MTVTNSETGLLNFYRASQLHSGLILGQMVRRTNDARLILSLTRHSAEEVMHAQLWTETIIAIGGRPASVRDTYQTRYAAAMGAPTSVLEVLALTQIFARRLHQRPHTPAETGSERGSRDCPKLTRLTYQRDRFRYLVPQTTLCTSLRPRDQLAKLHNVSTRKRITRSRNDLIGLGMELIESFGQRFRRVLTS